MTITAPPAAGLSVTADTVGQWLQQHPLSAAEVDCAVAVMLKIMDGKCRMADDEKVIMSQLYRAVKHQPGKLLDDGVHQLIATASHQLAVSADAEQADAIRLLIYEQRLLAETRISRPVMKQFKAGLRRHGLLPPRGN